MITREEYLNAVDIIKEYRTQINDESRQITNILKPIDITLESSIHDVAKFTYASKIKYYINDLKGARSIFDDVKIKELSGIDIAEFRRRRNVGKGCIKKALEICRDFGLPVSAPEWAIKLIE